MKMSLIYSEKRVVTGTYTDPDFHGLTHAGFVTGLQTLGPGRVFTGLLYMIQESKNGKQHPGLHLPLSVIWESDVIGIDFWLPETNQHLFYVVSDLLLKFFDRF